MRKRYLLVLLPILTAAMMYGPRLLAGPEARTQAFFAVQRLWMAHWPFESGKHIPRLLLPGVLPMAPVWLQVGPGVKMQLDPVDFVSHAILESGTWEPVSWSMMAEHLSPGATFIDVGAQIGYYSLKAARVVGSAGHVIAIEPNPDTLRKLHLNIAASDAAVVSVAPVACSNAEAMLDLFAAADANTGETSLAKNNALQAGGSVRTYQVRARPLDDIVRESGVTRVDFIKLDVEGAEYLVLQGAQQTLDRFHPTLMVEMIDAQLREMGSSTSQVVAFLRAHGYTAGRIDGENIEFTALKVSAAVHQ